jgi:replicative DNA helicase
MTEMARSAALAHIGAENMGTGAAYLHTLMQYAGDIGYYAPIVKAGFAQFNMGATLESCFGLISSPGFDANVHLEQIRAMVESAASFGEESALRPNSEAVTELLDGLESEIDPGLPTGYEDLDAAIGGMRDGELIVIGARPGNGKSLLLLCIADHVATRLALPVLFSSLEMSEHELTQRRVSATARVPLTNIVRHCVTDREWELIRRTQADLMNTSLFVDDTPSATLAHIKSKLRAMERAGNPARLAVIDYLGFMKTATTESRQQAIADLVRGCKNQIAREFNIPVILAAQLNRLVDSRTDKRPQLSDFRESGEIEQSANIAILLHREDYYERESPRAGEIDLLILKNRQGPSPCTVTLCFEGHYGRIIDMAWSATRIAENDNAGRAA